MFSLIQPLQRLTVKTMPFQWPSRPTIIWLPVPSVNSSYASSHSRCSVTASLASSSSVQCSSTSGPLLSPLLGKIFHNELYCLHLHFLPNLSSPFPIIILFPPILSSLVILFKSQPTPQHTLSLFPRCLLLVCLSLFFFVFITHLSNRARGPGPEWVLHQHVQICWINSTMPSTHTVGAHYFLINNMNLQIIFYTRKGYTDFFHFMNFSVNKNWKWLYIRNRCVSSVYSKTLSFKEWKILVVHSRRNYWTNNRFTEPIAMLKEYRQCHITSEMLIQML